MQTIDELKTLTSELQKEISLIKKFVGLETVWLSPNDAERLSPWSSKQVLGQIAIAEHKRRSGEKFDLIYGEHYINVTQTHVFKDGALVDSGKTKPTYKINLPLYSEVVSRPEEERLY